MEPMREVEFDGAVNSAERYAIKQIFERYERETITEDQIQRVLAPILQMIRDGEFSKRRRMRRIRKAIVGAVACAAVVVLGLYAAAPGAWLEIPESPIPLAGPFAAGSLSGKVVLEGKGVSGVALTLLDTDSGERTVLVTDSEGHYAFHEIPGGTYRLDVEPPGGTELAGSGGFLFAITGGESWKGVEIRLCTTVD